MGSIRYFLIYSYQTQHKRIFYIKLGAASFDTAPQKTREVAPIPHLTNTRMQNYCTLLSIQLSIWLLTAPVPPKIQA